MLTPQRLLKVGLRRSQPHNNLSGNEFASDVIEEPAEFPRRPDSIRPHQTAGLVSVLLLALGVYWVHLNGVGVLGWNGHWLRNSDEIIRSLSSDPQQKGTLRVVCISDTHGKHRNIKNIPDGDVLLHCGDFTNRGTHNEIRDFNDWLGALPHRHKVVIAGNHDLCMDAAEYDLHWDKEFRHKEYNDPSVSRALLSNCTYLENRSVVIDGIKIYGSPMTPPIPGRIAAFNVARGFADQQHWAKIPADVDVLVTHGPPHGILDKTVTGLHVGSETLLKETMSREVYASLSCHRCLVKLRICTDTVVALNVNFFGDLMLLGGMAALVAQVLLLEPILPEFKRMVYRLTAEPTLMMRHALLDQEKLHGCRGGVGNLVMSPMLGQASDVYGRKPFLVLSQVVRVGTPFTVMYFMQPGGSIAPYFILRLVDSGFGTAGVTSAAVADVVAPEDRAVAFGITFESLSVGYCISAFTAPFFSREHILHIAAGLFVARVLWAIFILPETLPIRAQANKARWVVENPISSMSILFRNQLFMRLTLLIALTTFVMFGTFQIQAFFLNVSTPSEFIV
ncbi:hypothetical protein G195_006745 [Phytophthora kernoviae 00238/432]|uniref:Calcineurin-like phosphoesterase domain-containing protein n=1 Tax=Phytophthora kernoviae 00238/432 TaxID=1284355 RepID=A0A8J4SCW6_9STRA|nr:hypothetical protein G195_006745 [Phytophthora kernoviae 00238/432]